PPARLPPASTLFPYTRSSDLVRVALGHPAEGVHLVLERDGEVVPDLPLERGAAPGRPPAVGDHHGEALLGPPLRLQEHPLGGEQDRKSTRLNSSHVKISYAVF